MGVDLSVFCGCSSTEEFPLVVGSTCKRNSNFLMTHIRNYNHYSRDFQAEQKFKRVKSIKPDIQVTVQAVYPRHLKHFVGEMLEFVDEKTICESSRSWVGSIGENPIKFQVQTMLIDERMNQNTKEFEQIDVFLLFLDEFTDLGHAQNTIVTINDSCRDDTLVYIVSAKTDTILTKSFLEDKSSLQIDSLNQSIEDSKKAINKMKKWTKEALNIYDNTDFLLIDFDKEEDIFYQLEHVLNSSIYSQESTMRGNNNSEVLQELAVFQSSSKKLPESIPIINRQQQKGNLIQE